VGHGGSRPAAAVAHDARSCRRSPRRYVPTVVGYDDMSVTCYGPTSWPWATAPTAVPHGGMSLTLWATAVDV
jgi:hypothetical protein